MIPLRHLRRSAQDALSYVWTADEVIYAPELAVAELHIKELAGYMEEMQGAGDRKCLKAESISLLPELKCCDHATICCADSLRVFLIAPTK